MIDMLLTVIGCMGVFIFWGCLLGGITGLFSKDWTAAKELFQGGAGLASVVPLMMLIAWVLNLAR